MSNSESGNTCRVVCWAIAGLFGLLLLWKLSESLAFLLALLISIVLVVILGIVLTRLFCVAEESASYSASAPTPTPTPAPSPAPKPAEKPAPAAKSASPAASKQPSTAKKSAPPAAKTEGGARPAALDAPRGGKADDLKQIKGVGPKLEAQCNALGIYHFDQIAAWGPDEVAWMDDNLKGFKGRVSRDNWIEQAKILAAGGETEFSKRAKDGKVY
jgi:predicted flap endonuclease-1-like 5' DNA nuclease